MKDLVVEQASGEPPGRRGSVRHPAALAEPPAQRARFRPLRISVTPRALRTGRARCGGDDGRASQPERDASSCASSPRAPAETAWALHQPRNRQAHGARSRCATAFPAPRSSSRFPPHDEVLFFAAVLSIILARHEAVAGSRWRSAAPATRIRPRPTWREGTCSSTLATARRRSRIPRSRAAFAPQRPRRERLGDTLYDLGRKEEALGAYRDAAASNPDSVTRASGSARPGDKAPCECARRAGHRLQHAPPTSSCSSPGATRARAGRKAALADYERAVTLKSDKRSRPVPVWPCAAGDGQVTEAAATFGPPGQVSRRRPQGHYGRHACSPPAARRAGRGGASGAASPRRARCPCAARGAGAQGRGARERRHARHGSLAGADAGRRCVLALVQGPAVPSDRVAVAARHPD